MAATDTGPAQASRVVRRWTLPVPLLRGESLGSWLVRVALSHGCSPGILSAWVWPDWRAWITDVDRGISSERLGMLAQASGLDVDALRSATLAPLAEVIEGATPEANAAWNWIIPRGRTTPGDSPSPQYCPVCVATDPDPYLRLHWRLAWHTVCTSHNTRLSDSCPECGAKVIPHRLRETARHACICALCGANLGDATLLERDRNAAAFQSAADEALRHGSATFLDSRLEAPEWFQAARFFVSFLRQTSRHPGGTALSLLEHLGTTPAPPASRPGGVAFERLPTTDRQAILGRVWPIMNSRADAFRDAVLRSGISRQSLCGDGQKLPDAVDRALPDVPDNSRARYRPRSGRPTGPRDRHEVVRMMNRLRRDLGAPRA